MKLSELAALPRDPNARWYSFAASADAEHQELAGGPVDAPIDGHWCLLIGPANSRSAQRIATREMIRHYGKADKSGALPRELDLEISVEINASATVYDWANLTAEDGSEVPYSATKYREIVKKYPEVQAFVSRWSAEVMAEVARARKDAEGNSGGGSAGN